MRRPPTDEAPERASDQDTFDGDANDERVPHDCEYCLHRTHFLLVVTAIGRDAPAPRPLCSTPPAATGRIVSVINRALTSASGQGARSTRQCCITIAEMLPKECRDIPIAGHTILELEHIMAFVLEHQIPHLAAKCRETCDEIG